MVHLLSASLVSLYVVLALAVPLTQAQADPTGPPASSLAGAPAPVAEAPVVRPSATAEPARQAPMPSAAEIAYAQEVLHTQLQRERLLSLNRDYRGPAVALGLGVASLITGAVVFSLAWRTTYPVCEWDQSSSFCEDSDDFNRRADLTGLIMMPLGAALILVSGPILARRLSRHNRLRSAERYLDQLSHWTGQVSLQTPTRQTMGLTTRFRF
jgi:hypothetical protein